MAVRKPLVMIGGVVRGLPAGDSISGAVEDNDPRLSDAREWTASEVSQAEAEAGTATTARKWTAQRVRQAIAGWWSGIGTAFGKSLLSLTDAAAGRTALGLGNVDNTSDADKPISTATANALDTKFDKTGGTISGAFGYGPDVGGTVVQPVSNTKTVVLNKPSGRIEMAEFISPGESAYFTVNSNVVEYGDLIIASSGNALTLYSVEAEVAQNGYFRLWVKNVSTILPTIAPIIHFAVIKGATT